MIKNKYGCSDQIWKKYTEAQRKMWNGCFEVLNSPANYTNAVPLEKIHVIAHNLACVAVVSFPKILVDSLRPEPKLKTIYV